jgi:UDP-N-acetylglucosamine 2-epimerase (non-hydrolysing)
MKILAVVGARPNFVKIAPIIAEARKRPWIEFLLVHTGQHYDPEMSGCFFHELGIPRPDVSLGDNDHCGTRPAPARMRIGEMARRLDLVLASRRPDIVLVVGDVNSTVAGALAAVRIGIRLAHLEAGLRSFDFMMPEETNRVITDALSDLLLVSEPSGVRNLLNEGKSSDQIFMVGNVMIDSLKEYLLPASRSKILSKLELCENDGREVKRYALLTLHRAATVDSPQTLRAMWDALLSISLRIPVVFPVHPRTHMRLHQLGLDLSQISPSLGNLRIIPPLGYLDFLWLERNATLVLTDSGGVQEETTALGVPCLTLRDSTERPITVLEGSNTLVGLDPRNLMPHVEQVLCGDGKTGRVPDLWDGFAAGRALEAISQIQLRSKTSCQLTRTHLDPPAPLTSPASSFPPSYLPRSL